MHYPVEVVEFPTTRVAAVEYQGPPQHELRATHQLIKWRREHGISPDRADPYGVHYNDPYQTRPRDYRMDICVTYDGDVYTNPHGVVAKLIPGSLCARTRHLGSRGYMPEADYLHNEWLPGSAYELNDFPIFFHYINVGPDITVEEMVTDLYLPVRQRQT